MEMELSEKQLAKFNKKDIIQLLLQSMENEKQLRAEVTELTRELKKTNQQMQPVPDSLPLSRIWIRLRSEPINVKSKRENAKTT